MKTYRYLIAIPAALLILSGCHKKEKESEYGLPHIDVAEATTDSVVLSKTYPGYLEAGTSADVVALVNGRLLEKKYQSGGYVNKGQVLFVIDPTIYKDQYERAQATLASAESALEYADSHYKAVKKALEDDAVSKMEVLSAESSLEQAQANVKDSKAALNTARTNLGYCTVVAPISGYISDNIVSEGNYVSGAASPVTLATIYDNSSMTVVFEIEDAQYEKMVGRDGGMGAPIYRGIPLKFREQMVHNFTADLSYQSPNVNKSTGTIILKGDVKNIDNELKNGMYVTVDLPYGSNPKAVLVKDASIGTDQLGKYVYLVNDSNKVVYTPIEVGAVFQDSLRVVDKGLKAGDKYVTKALLTVRNGETISPVLTK